MHVYTRHNEVLVLDSKPDEVYAHSPAKFAFFVFAARCILKTTLDAMEDFLRESFTENDNDEDAMVVPLKQDE